MRWRQSIAIVLKKLFDCKYGRSRIEKGYTNVAKRLPQNVHYCSAVGGKGEGSFCCAFAWWESWEGENPRWRTMCFPTPTSNISARRQTFRLGFVKHFGSASNISARRQTFRLDARKCWELINNLTMMPTKTTTHIFQAIHFKCSVFYEYPNCLSFILLLETGFQF